MKNIMIIAGITACSFAHAGFWNWSLDNNLNEAAGGPSLALNNPNAGVFESDTVNGGTATVMKFSSIPLQANPFLSLVNPMAANGGGTLTNQYTILFDMRIVDGDFQSLMQTNSADANATDGDWFVRSDNGLGISGDYTDAGNATRLSSNAWDRVVLTIDQTVAGEYRSYVNGVLQNQVQDPSGFGIDGRYGIGQNVHFFADEDGEVRSNWWVNNIAVWDRALTANEVAALGGATADAVPEPATMVIIATGVAALLNRRRK